MDKAFSGALSATQTYGKIRMTFTIIICSFLLLLSIIGLIYINFSYEKNFKEETATITSKPMCNKINDRKGNEIITGTTDIKFNYDGKTYNSNVSLGNLCYKYNKDSKIIVEFDPNNINSSVKVKDLDGKNIFNIILIIVAVICVLVISYDYFFRNNKVAQTMSGVEGITGLFRN